MFNGASAEPRGTRDADGHAGQAREPDQGLLVTQGVSVFKPIRKDRRQAVEKLRRWDGEALPPRLKATLLREFDRLELVMSQLVVVEAERDRALQTDDAVREEVVRQPPPRIAGVNRSGAQLLRLRGTGLDIASVLAPEAFYRKFANRREIAAYSGLTPSPWNSGGIDVEQGISKAGNSRQARRWSSWLGCGCNINLAAS